MKQITIKPEQVKNVKGIKNAYELVDDSIPEGKFDKDWKYKGIPEFEVDINEYVSYIEYFDSEGLLRDDYFTISHEGEELVKDKLVNYQTWTKVGINKYIGTLKIKGSLIATKLKFFTKEDAPEPENGIISSDQSVSFSGVYGNYSDATGKFIITLDKKPTDFKVEDIVTTDPIEEPPIKEPDPIVSRPEEPRLDTNKLIFIKTGIGEVPNVALYLPKDYYDTDKEYPVLIKLHGNGEKATAMSIQNMVTKSEPEKSITKGVEKDFILICPQTNYTWGDKGHDILKALKKVIDNILLLLELEEDKTTIWITGLSDGGMGTWNFTAMYPEFVTAAIPICGWCTHENICNAKNVPIWAFHNRRDNVVGVGGTMTAVKNLKACGSGVLETIYETNGHDAWTRTYSNEEVWKWLSKQIK